MSAAAATRPKWKQIFVAILLSLRSQWLASTLVIPLCLLAAEKYSDHYESQQDKVEAETQQRIDKVLTSGKALDIAVASFFDALSEFGLAQNGIKAPGAFDVAPVEDAQKALAASRKEALKAFSEHAGDVQSLRGTLDPAASKRYISSLAAMARVIEGEPRIQDTGRNITQMGDMVVERNRLVDQAKRNLGN